MEAHALEVSGEFTVSKGSPVCLQAQSGWTSYKTLREQLVAAHKIGPNAPPDLLVFPKDVPFREYVQRERLDDFAAEREAIQGVS